MKTLGSSLGRVVAAIMLLVSCAQAAWAHGYVSTPASRAALCKTAVNTQCGPVQYEPQSLEALSGFPAAGPTDGRIASANLAQFSALDEQTSSRWAKRPISAGTQNFTWTLTAPHVTRSFRYYITRADWNPNVSLSRASFEAQPFCQIDGAMAIPAATVTHACKVPARKGYQVILAVWEVGNTVNSFYNVIDVAFQGSGTTPPATPAWTVRGSILGSVDLKAGDSVATRVFDASGELASMATQLTVANSSDGLRDNWPFLLAQRINATQTLMRAGQTDANGLISPVQGRNEVFARSDSGVTRVEVQVNQAAPGYNPDLLVSGLASAYTLQAGTLNLDFQVTAVGEMEVQATLFDAAGQTKGVAGTSLNNSGSTLRISAKGLAAGRHQLVLKGVVKGSGLLLQKTVEVLLVNPVGAVAQYTFPEGLKQYKAGALVRQPKDGKVYECRPWPNSGYCVQWSPSANQFEPGIGPSWEMAWIRR